MLVVRSIRAPRVFLLNMTISITQLETQWRPHSSAVSTTLNPLWRLSISTTICRYSQPLYSENPLPSTIRKKLTRLPAPQDDPSGWTFGMLVQGASLGLSGSNTSGKSFAVMDSECVLRGIYGPNSRECGVPWTIFANYLPYTIDITSVYLNVGAPSVHFSYSDGKYGTSLNDATCETISNKGNGAVKGCRVPFPAE